jgi:hypothetical protein
MASVAEMVLLVDGGAGAISRTEGLAGVSRSDELPRSSASSWTAVPRAEAGGRMLGGDNRLA